MRPVHGLAGVVSAALIALLSGCGSSQGTVSGEVTYEGQPVGNGYITFTPVGGQGKDAGGPIVNGRYQQIQLPPGTKVARILAVKKVSFASTSEEMKRKAADARRDGDYNGLVEPADTIADTAEGNNVEVEIAAGDNVHDFHLKKPAKN
jgi:hypothetical protein